MFNREYHVRAVRKEVRKRLLSGAAQEFYRPANRPDPRARPTVINHPDRPLEDVFPEAYANAGPLPGPDPEPEPSEGSLPMGRKCRRANKSNPAQLELFR